MYIDTHCHLSIEDYDDIDQVIDDNRKSGIDKIIVSGCTKDSILESLEYSKKYDDVYLTIGFHPSEVNDINTDDIYVLSQQLKEDKVVGIGEIGLDYHYGKEDIDQQKDLFRKQMKIAEDINMPVVIHSRDATADTIEILKKFPKVRGVIHCFSGSVETAHEYIKMGYVLGIGGVVTFKNSNLYKVIENIGINNIIFETYSPYLTPEPYRGKKNSSKYIPIISKKISDIIGIDEKIVAKKVYENTINLFDLR